MSIQLYNDDCLQVMQKLIDNGVKVDAIITDPLMVFLINLPGRLIRQKDFLKYSMMVNLTMILLVGRVNY